RVEQPDGLPGPADRQRRPVRGEREGPGAPVGDDVADRAPGPPRPETAPTRPPSGAIARPTAPGPRRHTRAPVLRSNRWMPRLVPTTRASPAGLNAGVGVCGAGT